MAYERTNPVASAGWFRQPGRSTPAWGITERVDGYCATSYTYSRRPQPVPRLDVAAAMADIGCWPYERPYPMEAMMTAINAEPADPTARSVKPARIGNVMISLNQRPEMNDRSHPLTATPRAHRDSLLSPMAGAEVEGEPMKRARLMGYLRAQEA